MNEPVATNLRIDCVHDARLCYAMQQNAVALVPLLRIVNDGADEVRDLELRVRLEPDLAPPFVARIAAIGKGAAFALADLPLQPRPEALANATERQQATLRVEVHGADGLLCGQDHPVEVLAYNEWPGAASQPALLAAFVLPNHPAVAPVLREAASRLAAATGSAALDGYRGRDPRRVLATAQAVYEVLLQRGIAYVHPPASFEQQGQKVRTPEQVLHERMGTCLDLAVLYAACLEQAGLHALLVVGDGHAVAGVRLEDEPGAEAATADPLPLRKRVELERIALVECTALCSTQVQPFARACELGRATVAADAGFLFAVDVAVARRAGVRPLPARTNAFAVAAATAAAVAVPADAPLPAATVPVPAAAPAAPPRADEDRLARWQRRLLDLSLRNRLLNFTETKRSLRLQTRRLDELLTALSGGAAVRVLPRAQVPATTAPPGAAAGNGGNGDGAKGAADGPAPVPSEALERWLAQQLQARRLHSELTAEELDRRLLEIWRQTRTANEESGVNTLFLAVGVLRWYETPTSPEPRRAPLWLLPLRIERVSIAEGFVLALADEEARVNDTLVQKLQHDFGIVVDGIDGDDEDGPDAATVLAAFRRAVVDVPRWEVEPAAWIGCFSFAKYLMWVDLEDRRDVLLQHPFLHHLVATPEQQFADDDGEWPAPAALDAVDPGQLLCPLDADSSQLCAVLAAAAGRSFVLEGPPGTGKSQTITNLVAQCLAAGKRVLFVAEKRAALEVVQQRLHQVGLSPFCLELHSGKGQKSSVVQQLGRALDLAQQQEPAEWAALARDLLQARAELNAHEHAVHRRREPGCSVFEATALAVAGRELPQIDGLPVDVDAEGLRQRRELVAALAATAAPLGPLAAHPWYGVRRPDWHPGLVRELAPLLSRVAQAVEPARAAFAASARLLSLAGEAAATGRAQVRHLADLARELASGPLPAGLLTVADFAAARERALQWLAVGERRVAAWQQLAPRWRPALLALDLAGLRAQLLRHGARLWPLRWWALRPVRAQLAAVAVGAAPRGAALAADLDRAQAVAAADAELAREHAAAAALLGSAWQAADSDFAALRSLLDRAGRALAAIDALAGADAVVAAALRVRAAEVAADAAAPRALLALVGTAGELQAAVAALAAPLQLCLVRAFGGERDPGYFDRLVARVGAWSNAGAALREQCAFQRDAAAARAAGLEPLELALECRRAAAEQLPAVFERSFAESWLAALFAREPALASFRGADHERRIARFRRLDAEAIALAGKVVRARLCAALPSLRSTAAESSELGVLLRELKKQRRHLAPRQLFARIPNLLTRLAPCLLMSPMTVAQVLGRAAGSFDVVVFDEASQVPVWDAVGAISRGKALVVVGDSRQLPPTQFFQRLDGEDAQELETDRVEELESVLDECGAAGLRRLHLRWHYRSRHESLIAFSNHHYYENRLLTFPAPDRQGALGVRFVPVAGVYDRARSQTNPIEAKALVDELVRRLLAAGDEGHSHGVVTFSMAQQVLVEDLLEQARQAHPAIERHFAGVAEPVFVKNLENVQGDERDVMLFSICYGPDQAGKVHMHFGPLNLQGGERRLNVAVTRARRELLVFSSLRAEQIALQRTQSLGVRHLRAFLDYAVRGDAALASEVATSPAGAFESPFERAVAAALQRRGCEVHAQIGCSGYRIDLAVVDPRQPGRYVLGVECDGATYHAAATARDRDRLRQAVLERLGWRLFRFWSTDWWLDAEGELRRFDAALAAALQAPLPAVAAAAAVRIAAAGSAGPVAPSAGSAEPPPAGSPATVSALPAAPPPAAATDGSDNGGSGGGPELPVYANAALAVAGGADAFFLQRNTPIVREQVAAVLAAEAPIVLELLARRVAAAWEVGRTTERVRLRVQQALPAGVVERDGALWPPGTDPAAWVGFRTSPSGAAARDADLLPAIEIEAAMAWVLRQHGSLAEDDLLRETARLFGFARLGTAVRAAMATGLAALLDRQAVQRGDGVLRPG